MVEARNHDELEDIISSLNNIREELDQAFQASTSGFEGDEGRKKPEEDVGAIALEKYLASRLQQIGEVSSDRKEIKGLKTGNGWDAEKVIEHVYKIEPISIKRAIDVSFQSHRTFKDRIVDFLTRRREERRVITTPTVEFIPIWKVKGFHECYYLRTNSYKVNVKDDVVGVEVEGKSRDLILEKRHRSFIPAAIMGRIQKLGAFLTSESKYFVVSDVLELATKKSQSELAMTGFGRNLSPDEDMALTSWRTKRIFDLSELKVRGARVEVRDASMSKEVVIAKFRDQVVHMPERFKEILSNRLEILDLKKIYVPFIRISFQKGLVPHEAIVNGSSGELAVANQIELLE
jgi:hypothetical protein